MTRIGELFAGYGGLGMGVKAAIGGEVAWVSEIDPGACKVLAHRFPDAPNIGDVTAVDWSQVEPVDVLTGGFPCQDVSTAGKRAGMKPGTRSGLWTHFAYAIDQLRPRLVVAENVRGLLSAQAHSDVEPCPWCVGDDPDGAMRALGAVLADLADLGYDAQWCGLRAGHPNDTQPHVGGCHGRFRVFVAAHPRGSRRDGWAPVAFRQPFARTATTRSGEGVVTQLLPTPRATDGTNGGPNQRGSSGDLMLPSAVAKLLPTPTTEPQTGNGHARNNGQSNVTLTDAVVRGKGMALLPTPMANEGDKAGQNPRNSAGQEYLTHVVHADRWGDYADSIARWEYVLGRPAPSPTETSPKTGRPRLSPCFEEWMMGLPDGWITNTPDVTWQEAVRMCGNGVVPQQAEAAVRWLLTLDHLAREAS